MPPVFRDTLSIPTSGILSASVNNYQAPTIIVEFGVSAILDSRQHYAKNK